MSKTWNQSLCLMPTYLSTKWSCRMETPIYRWNWVALLARSSLPFTYWAEAFETTMYLINLHPSSTLKHKSPYFMVHRCDPNYTFLKVFGCERWPNLRPYNSHKLNFRSTSYLFLGYSAIHKNLQMFGSYNQQTICWMSFFMKPLFLWQNLDPIQPNLPRLLQPFLYLFFIPRY